MSTLREGCDPFSKITPNLEIWEVSRLSTIKLRPESEIMDPDKHVDLLAESAAQYRWAIANFAVALLCVALAGGAFMFGYLVAGLLIIVVSFALVINSDQHKKRGQRFRREMELEP